MDFFSSFLPEVSVWIGGLQKHSCQNFSYFLKFLFLFPSSVCFKVFDVDRDGVLSRDELHEMVVALLEVWKDNRTDTIPVSKPSD